MRPRHRGPSALPTAPVTAHTATMIVDEGLELLTEDESAALLATGEIGRIGITMGAMPAIFPVSYAVVDGNIYFRTSPGSKLRAASEGAVVAFEVDDHDMAARSGWSVLAVGLASVVADHTTTARVLGTGLDPLADGVRSTLVRIEPTFISGRRILSPADPTTGDG